jgi:hypothetical protein
VGLHNTLPPTARPEPQQPWEPACPYCTEPVILGDHPPEPVYDNEEGDWYHLECWHEQNESWFDYEGEDYVQ